MEGTTPNPAQTPADSGAASAQDTPQNLDKTDAMTYPLGSQSAAPAGSQTQSAPEEEHGSILDKIMGIFSRGKKQEQPQQTTPTPTDQAPTNTTPPPGQQ